MDEKTFDSENEINSVLKHHDNLLKEIHFSGGKELDLQIGESEQLLRTLGYGLPNRKGIVKDKDKNTVIIRTWDEIYAEASKFVAGAGDIKGLFTEKELKSNEEVVCIMNAEFNQIYHLDKMDVAITALAGMVGAAVDILMVGIPQKTSDGLKGGPLSNFIRDYFDRKFPEEEMQKLANSKESKVPFDAQDNRHTTIRVEGLSAYYHRLLQLGHDPVLGFIFGIADIMTGRMTTIDKTGKIVSQVMDNYADRTEAELFRALAKQIAHFKSDTTTSMGLPVPFMSLFNLLQFGDIGEYDQTIAEIVQGMYYEGYDFIHFCSMSIPTMLVEVIVRMGYAFKRISEGYPIGESIPVSLNREKHPKLATMLFMGHSAATAVNTGKVLFSENPMAINYPQWIAFAKYSYEQLKWALVEKPALRDAYMSGKIYEEMLDVFDEVEQTFNEFTKDKIVIYS